MEIATLFYQAYCFLSQDFRKKKSLTSPYHRLANRKKPILPQKKYFEGHDY